MRVVHGLHWSKGGIVKLLALLLSNMTTSIYEHHVIILDSDDDSNHQLEKYCNSYNSLRWEKNKIGGIIRFIKSIKELKPDIYHAHSFVPGVIGRAFLPEDTTCIATIHNEYPHYKSKTLKNIIKKTIEYKSLKKHCQAVVCVSESVRQLVDQAMPGLLLETIQNGVEQGFAKDSTKQDKDAFTILTLGRLDMQKGYDLLLDAFFILLKRGIDASLRIVGEGHLRPALEAQAEKLGIREKVFMPGFSQNPIKEFAGADIYVCSSRYEGFGLAVSEAMSFGLPLVTTYVGGVASIVQDGVDALVVPVNNPLALSDALYKLIQNQELRQKIGEAGRNFARENFDIRNTAQRYEMLYQKLVQKQWS